MTTLLLFFFNFLIFPSRYLTFEICSNLLDFLTNLRDYLKALNFKVFSYYYLHLFLANLQLKINTHTTRWLWGKFNDVEF
jgi:hypothetical protein